MAGGIALCHVFGVQCGCPVCLRPTACYAFVFRYCCSKSAQSSPLAGCAVLALALGGGQRCLRASIPQGMQELDHPLVAQEQTELVSVFLYH